MAKSAQSSATRTATSAAERISTALEIEPSLGIARAGWDPDKMVTPVHKTLTKENIEIFRKGAIDDLAIHPGRPRFSPTAPLFVSKPNIAGGRVWFSTFEVNFMDFALIAAERYQKGPVLIFSGAHGDMFGRLKAFPGILELER